MSPSSAVLVDTSVFIDYFRSGSASSEILTDLLMQQRVVISPYVRLELLMGVRKEERAVLNDLLSALPLATLTSKLFDSAEKFIGLVRGHGIAVGLVDYLIALQAAELGVPLLTFDKVMRKVSQLLEVEILGTTNRN